MRRFLHCTLSCISLAVIAAPAAARELLFDAQLDGRPVGTHQFRITPTAEGGERVQSEARFDVKLLGLFTLRYQHRAEEQWRAGCLTQVEARTTQTGGNTEVRGTRQGERFVLDQPRRRELDTPCIATYAYWDLPRLQRQRALLNPQTGDYDSARLEPLGEETLRLRGREVTTQRYRLHAAKLAIDLWYDAQGQWLQLESRAAGDRLLRYQLRE